MRLSPVLGFVYDAALLLPLEYERLIRGSAMPIDHISYMQQALDLAELGRFSVSPNPMVGCVIVKDGHIIGQGYHQRHGEAHAEILALHAAGANAKNATMYVTLEPCPHFGKTPPCTTSIIASGIKEVYVACLDQNPIVAGGGCETLRAAGIQVTVGLLEEKARLLNTMFFHYIQKKRPFVIAKWAMSLDGKTVTNDQADRHITTEATQLSAHSMRQQVDAILVGANTVRLDNPKLTVRQEGNPSPKQPLRIILSTRGDLPLDLQVLNTALPGKTLLAISDTASAELTEHCLNHQIELLSIPSLANHRADLPRFLTLLAERGITSLLVEGGMSLHEQLFQANLVDKVCVYLAPIIIGKAAKKIQCDHHQLQTVDHDYCITATIKENTHV